jgi:diguanylate cyclase (GGDEF)-like protein
MKWPRTLRLSDLAGTPSRALVSQAAAVSAGMLAGAVLLVVLAVEGDIDRNGATLLVLAGLFGAAAFWSGWLLVWRGLDAQERVEQRAQLGLATALDAVRMEAVVEHDEVWVEDLCDALSRLDQEHRRLRRTLDSERRQGSFARDLAEALDIADTEHEVFSIAERAASMHLPGSEFFLVTTRDGALEWEVATDTPACACKTARTCPALRKSRTLRFSPGSGLARCARLLDDQTHAICAPVGAGGTTLAVAQAAWTGPDRPELELSIETLAAAIGARLGVVRTLEEREVQAQTDPLTGLPNRRAMQALGEELEETEATYAVIACDLDHFKNLNDTWGHEVGDQCLKLFAQVLRDVCRTSDLPCRPGGEEFTVVLPQANAMNAVVVAERIRVRLREASARLGRPFTASMGVAGREHGQDFDDVLGLADKALYQAKGDGRDRVHLHGSVLLDEDDVAA